MPSRMTAPSSKPKEARRRRYWRLSRGYSRTMRPRRPRRDRGQGPLRSDGRPGGLPGWRLDQKRPRYRKAAREAAARSESDVVINMAVGKRSAHASRSRKPDRPSSNCCATRPACKTRNRWRQITVTYNAGDYSGYSHAPRFSTRRWRPSGSDAVAHRRTSTICPSCHAIRRIRPGPRRQSYWPSCAGPWRCKPAGQGSRAVKSTARRRRNHSSLPGCPS